MEAQLISVKIDEKVAWVKIIENILVVANPSQLDRGTKGEWQRSLLRCLTSLLHEAGSHCSRVKPLSRFDLIFPDFSLLRLISRCLTRLNSEYLSRSNDLKRALEKAMDCLTSFEKRASLYLKQERYLSFNRQGVLDPLPPHKSHGAPQLSSSEDMQGWGVVVERLWAVCMSCETDGPVWSRLTSRLLLWRAVTSASESELGEWARKQVILSLQNVHS